MYRTSIVYELIIGQPLKVSKDFFTPLKNESYPSIALEDYYSSKGTNGFKFTEHQIVFQVNKSSKDNTTNSMTCTLVNLEDSVVDYLSDNSDNNVVCLLKAGDNVTGALDIFQGTMTKLEDNFDDTDRLTKITVSDAVVNTKNAYTVRSYARNTPKEKILRDLANDLKLPFQKLSGISGNVERPTSFIGNTIDIMRSQAPNFFKADISIQDGAISVLPKNTRVAKEVSYITNTTGLIGSVSDYSDSSKSTSQTTSESAKGIKFRCLLDGNIKPNETVYVKDGKFDGPFKVVSVKHSGDYEGTNWTSEVVAVHTDGVIDQ